jgi:hypothetical protein
MTLNIGTLASYSLSFSLSLSLSRFSAKHTHHDVPSHYRAKSNIVKPLWTSASETVSQNKSFLVLN